MPKLQAPSLAEHNDRAWAALAGALEELLATTPYEDITLSKVAAAAGMARATLYNYAADKPALVSAVTGRAGAELLSAVTALAQGPGQPVERMEAIVRAILAWFVADKHRLVVAHGLFAEAPSAATQEAGAPLLALEAPVARLVEEGVADGGLRRPPDLGLTLDLLSSVMRTGVHRIVRRPQDLEMVTREALRIVRACLELEDGGAPSHEEP